MSVRGLELRAPVEGGHAEVLTEEALEFVAGLQRRFGPERQRLLAARAERQERIAAGELPDFLSDTREAREGDWRVAPVPADLQDRRCRDHRAGRPEDGHQRPELGRALLHGRLRGRELADVGELPRRACEPPRRHRPDDRAGDSGQDVSPERRDRGADRPPARLAPTRATRARGRRADLGQPVRLRPSLLPQRAAPARLGQRALLLPPEAREPSRGAALERRLRGSPGRRSASRAARSRRPFSSRRSWPPSRWRRSSTSSATTPRA